MKNKINKICITTRCEQCKNYMKCFEYKQKRKRNERNNSTKSNK